MRDGGFSTLPVLTMVQRPMEMAVCAEGFSFEAPPAALEGFSEDELVLLG
jgi:hypothetical protein